ncbi:MAG: CBS domain-containing protein [Candidatus Hadarchaeaceae archaeon]|nr:CBS domain-containing protein [Hadesarchaea archaeon]MDH5685563.1 CBS domain-containing protein [Hadesarchaea archaeon]
MRRFPHYKSIKRGPLAFKSRRHREEGSIMPLARKLVITASPTMRIKNAAELMVERGVRRLPVASPGTKKLIGIIRTRDIIDFLGGGEKFRIVQEKLKGNFFAAANEPVRTIMSERVIHGTTDMSMIDVVKLLLQTGVGGIPILDEREQIAGIVSERDFINYVPTKTGTPVSYHMTRHVITAEPELQIREAARRMISRGVRRLPVVRELELVGIVTSVDILRYFGTSKVFEHMISQRVDEAMSVGVEEIMTRDVLTVAPETDLGEATGLMRERECGCLPVIERGELKGIITEHDLLELLI